MVLYFGLFFITLPKAWPGTMSRSPYTLFLASASRLLGPNEAVVDFTISILNKYFKEVGIEPSVYLDVAREYNNHPTNLKYNNAVRKMIYDNKAQYIIDFSFTETPSLSKIKKNKANITDYVNPLNPQVENLDA